jgi:hypothetical protein
MSSLAKMDLSLKKESGLQGSIFIQLIDEGSASGIDFFCSLTELNLKLQSV